MLAWRQHQQSLHHRCGQPIEKAWHPKNDPVFYDARKIVCHACTAMDQANRSLREDDGKHAWHVVEDTRDYDTHPLPPFSMADFD